MPSKSRCALASIVLASLLLASIGSAGADAVPGSLDGAGADPTPPATTSYLEGIDVSHWQGTINWSKVAGAGKRFAIIKATDGIKDSGGNLYFVDPNYSFNHAGARAVGIRTSAYHFARPDSTPGDAVAEADWFVDHAKLGDGDLIPALDLEKTGGLGPTALQGWVKAWMDEVTKRLGARPMIYVSPSFWKTYMGDTTSFCSSGYKVLWIAHWTTASSPSVPANNWCGFGWTFWQYTSDGSVAGISGRVDLDRYNGTDLTPVLYDPGFKLSASPTSASVEQGRSASYTLGIKRTNYPAPIDLSIDGLPAGAGAAFNPDPAGGTSATLSVTTSRTGTVTPVGSYPLKITGVGPGDTETLNVTLVVTDGIPPTVAPPFPNLYAGSRLGSTTAPVRIHWSATDPSGIYSYRLQRQVNGGSWSSVTLPTKTTTTIRPHLTIGSSYRFRVSATDGKGNASAWVYGPTFKPRRAQQSSSSVSYHGTWHTSSLSSASGGSLRYATAAGAWASYSFWGSSVAWVAYKGPNRGSAKVYVDGVYKTTISLHSSTYKSRAIVYAATWASNGSHVLKIVVNGTAGHPRVDVDAFAKLTLL